MSKKMDINAELDDFIEENEGQVTLTDIAKHFADYGYQYAVDKACEFIQKTLGTDFMVERFKQFMEE